MTYEEKIAAAREHAKLARKIYDGAKGRQMTDTEAKSYQNHYDLAVGLKVEADRMEKAAEQHAKLDFLANADDMDPDAAGSPLGKTAGVKTSTWTRQVTNTLNKAAGGVGAKALLSGEFRVPAVAPVAALPSLPQNVLDLIPKEAIDTNSYAFIRQTLRDEHAAVVPDLAEKPQSLYALEEVVGKASVIAHLSEPFPVRWLTDFGSIAQVLDSQMVGGVMGALEAEILSGNGTGDHFTGLFNTSGVRQVGYKTDLLTTFRAARTTLEMAVERPNAVILHPEDAAEVELLRENGSTGAFLMNSGVADMIFGPDVTRITSLGTPKGTALMGDFTQARLYVRENASTLAATQGTAKVGGETVDLFASNAVRLRSEGRYGFSVVRPSAFAVVDLTA